MNKYGVAIVGCGTVGGGCALLLERDAEVIRKRAGVNLSLKYIVDLDFKRATALGLSEKLFCDDLEKALNDDSVDVVIELIGGLTAARRVIERAFEAGKNVVTANKALLAYHGTELFAMAREKGVSLAIEASCAGGIPIISVLSEGLSANRIEAVYGIVNGTCNFILSEMTAKGISYEDALQSAQKEGFAEADPTLDVSGMDSAHKITIMSSLAFGRRFSLNDIPVEGIEKVDGMDIRFGCEMGYSLKLIAAAKRIGEGFAISVAPSFVPADHLLSSVNGSFNAVSIYGHAVGHSLYYGRGAGDSPTASAVVADIISLAQGRYSTLYGQSPLFPDKTEPAEVIDIREGEGRFYLRIRAKDQPGVIGAAATFLGEEKVGIESLNQKIESSKAIADIIILTHTTRGEAVNRAIEKIENHDEITYCRCIPIMEEHPENL